jgi:hypothetical protein
LLDLTDLWDSRQNASITIDPATGRMTGNGMFLSSFGAESYVMHFCADFASESTGMRDNGAHINGRAETKPKHLFVTRGFNLFYVEADSGSTSHLILQPTRLSQVRGLASASSLQSKLAKTLKWIFLQPIESTILQSGTSMLWWKRRCHYGAKISTNNDHGRRRSV